MIFWKSLFCLYFSLSCWLYVCGASWSDSHLVDKRERENISSVLKHFLSQIFDQTDLFPNHHHSIVFSGLTSFRHFWLIFCNFCLQALYSKLVFYDGFFLIIIISDLTLLFRVWEVCWLMWLYNTVYWMCSLILIFVATIYSHCITHSWFSCWVGVNIHIFNCFRVCLVCTIFSFVGSFVWLYIENVTTFSVNLFNCLVVLLLTRWSL